MPNQKPVENEKTAVADDHTLKDRLEEAKASAPVLVVISGRPLGKSFFLTSSSMVLGRDLTADISIGETSISRRHTEFLIDASGIYVQDLGSTNGTFLNDQKLEAKQKLSDGDLVRCGSTILKFLKEGKIENIHYGKMYDLATQDDLTGALNKKALLDLIKEEFTRTSARSGNLSLLMFDLDHFKQINDKFGHLAGDYVLKEVCTLLKSKMIRQQDALGRYGGEEFILVLRETPVRVAVEVAERIRGTIERHSFSFEDKSIPVTISVGVATLDSAVATEEVLIGNADKALYDAKNQGRNRVSVR